MNKFIGSKKTVLIVAMGFVLLLGGAGAYYFNENKSQDNSSGEMSTYSTCDNDEFFSKIVQEQIFLTDKFEEFLPVAEQVKNTKGHESSPNCMYILTMYAINTGDREKVTEYYNQLQETYSQNSGYTGTWKESNVQTPDQLKPTIEFMQNEELTNGGPLEWEGGLEE